ncbi:hypothetical protein ACQEVS_23420 [Streptomyces sp. CA-181903]|uniref:hypothetical protein n=1 Tax=Streptomyces sp. CA-181903 TaxID=3240055 RepID=UPI003D8C2743
MRVTDAAGRAWSLFDKTSAFDAGGALGPDVSYPVDVTVACAVREERGGVVTVSTAPHGVATPDGREEFVVRWEQLVG